MPTASWDAGPSLRRLSLSITLCLLAGCGEPPFRHPVVDWEAECGDACAGPPVQVDVGEGSSCVRYAGGAVLCWGSRRGTEWSTGHDGPPLPPTVPRPPIELTTTGAIDLAISESHGCVIKADGTFWCWGDGYLGLGTVSAASPVPVAVPGASDVVAMGVGTGSCAVRADGATMTPLHELIVNEEAGATSCEVGRGFACRILFDQSLECWGDNDFGKLGRGDTVERSAGPVLLDEAATAVSLGVSHACALTPEGDVWCWGSNRQGQLGAPTAELSSSVPVRANIDRVAAVRAGGHATCAIRDDGQLHCWGSDRFGLRGGLDTATPTPVPGADDIVDVDIAANHGCLIRASGEVACWGSNAYGAIGQEPASVPFGQLQTVTGLPHHGAWPAMDSMGD